MVKEWEGNYNLGDCEFHLAFETDDMEAAHKLHEEMECICFENKEMGIYFIEDRWILVRNCSSKIEVNE